MRATELLGAPVVDPDGRRLGQVLDVRLVQDGPLLGADCALRIEGLVVGPGSGGSHLGYDRAGVRGPALIAWLSHRMTADNRYLPWDQVTGMADGVVTTSYDDLAPVPALGSDR
jgi:sporulation protein YlmC with PRC-barrel domain